MDGAEIQQMFVRLEAIGEYYGAAPFTDKAKEVWTDAFKNLRAPNVLGAINDWPKVGNKFPTIKELYAEATKRDAKDMERKVQDEATEKPALMRPTDPAVARALARYQAAQKNMPKRHPKFWLWEGLLDYVEHPERMSYLKRLLVINEFGENPSPGLVAQIRAQVTTQLHMESSRKRLLDYIDEERKRETGALDEPWELRA